MHAGHLTLHTQGVPTAIVSLWVKLSKRVVQPHDHNNSCLKNGILRNLHDLEATYEYSGITKGCRLPRATLTYRLSTQLDLSEIKHKG